MAFFERVCGYKDNGDRPAPLESIPLPLSVDRVHSACLMVLTSLETIQTVKEKLPLRTTVDDSGLSDEEDFQNWVNNAPNDVLIIDRIAKRRQYIDKMLAAVFMQNENMAGRLWLEYESPNDVRTKLGVPLATYPGQGGL